MSVFVILSEYCLINILHIFNCVFLLLPRPLIESMTIDMSLKHIIVKQNGIEVHVTLYQYYIIVALVL